AASDGLLPDGDLPSPAFERPRKREHGDWATNVAMVAGRGGNPREIAQVLVDRMPPSELVHRVEIAGPGFLNFHLSERWLHDVVRRAADPSAGFGRTSTGAGVKVNLEYVSANPTGPLTVVLGRHAAVGDTIGNLLEATGHEVTREFYYNDAGRQVILFAASVAAHYLRHFGVDADVPEEGYRGDYVADMAEQIAGEVGDRFVGVPEAERVAAMRELAVPRVMDSVKTSLERFGTQFDVWFLELKLHEAGEVKAAIEELRKRDLMEEKDGALWFLSSRFGDDKDRVVIRRDGTPTYFAADIGYVLDKFRRGFDHLIYLWGADHHGTIPRLLAVAEALGYDRTRLEIPLVQIVTLSRGGAAVKASKRAGVLVPLDELLDEVGRDAARYVFLTRSMDAPLDFDIELAKEQAPENPVYYVQYAHARICSILRKAEQDQIALPTRDAALEVLHHHSEDALMRKIASYEEVVPDAARLRAPQRITRYVEELAASFSAFYRDCKVMTDDDELTGARLYLCLATKAVIADALGLLGVDAPERM
ncbi:MAG: arginine--tRNA ligase, partial [Actinomycetota bacterium]|nr:arginine--tRNA ligase [Actinomycetota bacterium]